MVCSKVFGFVKGTLSPDYKLNYTSFTKRVWEKRQLKQK